MGAIQSLIEISLEKENKKINCGYRSCPVPRAWLHRARLHTIAIQFVKQYSTFIQINT